MAGWYLDLLGVTPSSPDNLTTASFKLAGTFAVQRAAAPTPMNQIVDCQVRGFFFIVGDVRQITYGSKYEDCS